MYVKRIRALRWLAMALRAQETAQVCCEPPSMAATRSQAQVTLF